MSGFMVQVLRPSGARQQLNGLSWENMAFTPQEWQDISGVELHWDEFSARAGEEGYFVLPNVLAGDFMGNSGIVRFRQRPDIRREIVYSAMPIFGVCRPGQGLLAIVEGMTFDYELVVEVQDGHYRLFPRFINDGFAGDEAISVRLIQLRGEDANYSGMARAYRRYQLERGACRPLKQRIVGNDVLARSVSSLAVRMRLAWKPVPPPVLEQTPENEPPMTVGMDFARAQQIVEEYSRQGIACSDICLVGWNKSGHDGRFPDLLPVEEKLGGEGALRQLITTARQAGYLIGAHTNPVDSYSISSRLRQEDWIHTSAGEPAKGGCWGGGQCYYLCPQQAYNYALEDVATLKELGFCGPHYQDVMTIVRTIPCHNPAHPLSRRQAAMWRGRVMALSQREFGSCMSEGPIDFCVDAMDACLYTSFHKAIPDDELCDEFIPLWHLVYHGIVLYNCFSDTVNYSFKDDPTLKLSNLEYGGRPAIYYYAKFLSSGEHWMGESDPPCATAADIAASTAVIKAEAEEYAAQSHLQLEFMEEHRQLSPGVYETRYANGALRVVDYNRLTTQLQE